MKNILIAVVMLSSIFAVAQKGTQSEQKACYEQAHQYVIDENDGKGDGERKWGLMYSHFDVPSKVCYIEMQMALGTGDTMLFSVVVADAYEGKVFAQVVHPLGGGIAPTCYVNHKKCTSRAEFNGLLWDWIPAFEPMAAQTVTRTPANQHYDTTPSPADIAAAKRLQHSREANCAPHCVPLR